MAVYDPSTGEWREWKLPGPRPQAYALYVDELDMVRLSDFGANAVLRFDPKSEEFEVLIYPVIPVMSGRFLADEVRCGCRSRQPINSW